MSIDKTYHVTAIGNALVDFLCSVSDKFIEELGLNKGSFSLIDFQQAKSLYQKMGPAQEISGGSAANTIAALSGLGAKTGFIGAIANDQIGEIFAHDIRSIGVDFQQITHQSSLDKETGRCYILVSDDAQRTMCTYLGVAGHIISQQMNKVLIENSEILYIEGYMWVLSETKNAILEAVDVSHKAGNKVAFTLSDVFCVNAYRKEFLELINNKFDIIFSNEDEVKALFQTDHLQDAITQAQNTGKLFVITCGEKGSIIIEKDEIIRVDAIKPQNLVDTTGAGDSFAAGFLYGLTQKLPYDKAAEIGSLIASEIISHIGARSETDLSKLIHNLKKAS